MLEFPLDENLIWGQGEDVKWSKEIREKYNFSMNPYSTVQLMVQKDRAEDLGKLKIPSLVIHGDEDPLVPLAGGKATADAIPGAKFIIVKGMGHVLPNLNAYWNDIKNAMLHHMKKVG